MEVEVNLVGVVLATVAAMAVGGIWYSKSVFGSEWMKLAKVNEKKAQKEAPKAMAVMLVLAFIAAYTVAYLAFAVGATVGEESYFTAAVQTSLMSWFGFVLYSQLSNGVFEQRNHRLLAINLGNSLVTFLVMGVVIGWVGL